MIRKTRLRLSLVAPTLTETKHNEKDVWLCGPEWRVELYWTGMKHTYQVSFFRSFVSLGKEKRREKQRTEKVGIAAASASCQGGAGDLSQATNQRAADDLVRAVRTKFFLCVFLGA